MTTYAFATVDVFTTARYQGNPLAIVKVPQSAPLSEEQKHAVTKEYNLSETVFLHEGDYASDEIRVDIWIVAGEVNFAGHPIIGTLCYIAQEELQHVEAAEIPIRLVTKAGPIKSRYLRTSRRAEASIPHNVRKHHMTASSGAISKSQPGLTSEILGADTRFPVVSIVKGLAFTLIKLHSLDEGLSLVKSYAPAIDFGTDALDDGWTPSFLGAYFYVKLPSTPDQSSDVVKVRTRMVEPSVGEDPCTGSAACTLAAHLSLESGGPSLTTTYEIEQGVEMGRPGKIEVRVTLDGSGQGIEEVVLAGSSVLVQRGTILV